MLHDILIIGMQYPVGKLVHIAPQTVTVLLDGISIVPAVSPTFQNFLPTLALLLLHNHSCLLQHSFQNGLFLHAQNFGTCLLDLIVKDVHPVKGFGSGSLIDLGSKLLFLIQFSLLCSFCLQFFQLSQTLLEDIQGTSFIGSQITHYNLFRSQGKDLSVCQGVCTLLELIIIGIYCSSSIVSTAA